LRVTDVCSNLLTEETITLPISITETYPIVLQNVNVTIQDNGVTVSWDASGYEAPDLNSYQIIQGDTPVGQVENATTYTDESTLNPSSFICYQIVYVTSCGFQTLDSPTVCTIALSVEEELETLTFNWTPYINSEEESATYILHQLNDLGEVVSSIELGDILSYSLASEEEDTENQILRYRIEATTSSGFVSASNVVTIERPARLFLPSAFTPNGDQLNDIFSGKGVFISEYSLEIFNKNGLKVFTSNELQEGWDGRYNQQDQPADTYLYVAEIKDVNGRTQQYQGTLQLIR
ncbi:MAG: gliding motility-associated C-terminal domain-containing protein, partial [Bacteroidota bacterium]